MSDACNGITQVGRNSKKDDGKQETNRGRRGGVDGPSGKLGLIEQVKAKDIV